MTMAAWVRGEEKASKIRQRKKEAEKADKVEVAPGVIVASLRYFRATLNDPTQELPKRRRLRRQGSMQALRRRRFVDVMPLGAMPLFGCKCEVGAIRGGIGCGSRLAVYQTLSSECPPCVGSVRVCYRHASVLILWVPCASLHPTYCYPFWLFFALFKNKKNLKSFCRFLFVLVLKLSSELCRGSSDIFLPSTPRTGWPNAYIAGYG